MNVRERRWQLEQREFTLGILGHHRGGWNETQEGDSVFNGGIQENVPRTLLQLKVNGR